jgi:hypothetical protein
LQKRGKKNVKKEKIQTGLHHATTIEGLLWSKGFPKQRNRKNVGIECHAILSSME